MFRRDDGDVLGNFIDENEASRTLAPAAVGTQVLLMSGISVRIDVSRSEERVIDVAMHFSS